MGEINRIMKLHCLIIVQSREKKKNAWKSASLGKCVQTFFFFFWSENSEKQRNNNIAEPRLNRNKYSVREKYIISLIENYYSHFFIICLMQINLPLGWSFSQVMGSCICLTFKGENNGMVPQWGRLSSFNWKEVAFP